MIFWNKFWWQCLSNSLLVLKHLVCSQQLVCMIRIFFVPVKIPIDYFFQLSKSTWGEQPVEDILKFTRIFGYVFMYLFIYLFVPRLLPKRKTIQTSNLAHILPLTLSENEFFVFSIKSPWLPCLVDFPHISSIALFVFYMFV